MLLNLILFLLADFFKQRIEFVSAEIFHPVTIQADQNMLMTAGRGDKSMAAAGLMHPLGQIEFFQFFKGTVDAHQSQLGMLFTSQVKYFLRIQRPLGFSHDFHDGFAGRRNAVSAEGELF